MILEELIKRCVERDRSAQEYLYRKYSSKLYGICLKYSRNKTEAEDNLHDSFMIIYDKIGQFRASGSFEGWLKRITVNTILQKYRKENYMSQLPEQYKDATDEPLPHLEVSLSTLLQYIQELPHKYRLTFNLYVLDGYSHKEISEQLGTSTGTSKSNLARARMILREKIKNQKIHIA